MKFSISFKYSNVTFKNKETKETIAYETKASDGNSFVFDNVDEDVVIGIVKGIKDKKASQVFSHDNFRTNFINTLARNKCKELYDKLDKAEWKIEDIAISNITIKDVEFTKPTMNAREAITVESKKVVKESANNFKPGDIVDWFVPEDDEQYGKEFGGEIFRGGEVYKKQGDAYEVSFGEEGLFYPQGKDLEYHSESLVESRKRIAESYWMTDYKWDQPYEVVFTDGSTFTIPGETEDPINFYRHYNNSSYKEIMRKTYGSGLELGKEIDHFNMPNENVITMDEIQDELDFYYDELKAKHSFEESKKMKKLNITKEQFNRSNYFQKKYGKLEYVSESGKLFKTNKGQILKFNESFEDIEDDEPDYFGDGQLHVFDYGEDFPFSEQYIVMYPSGTVLYTSVSGSVSYWDEGDTMSYSTRSEMEDNFATEDPETDDEYVPTEVSDLTSLPQRLKKMIIRASGSTGYDIDKDVENYL